MSLYSGFIVSIDDNERELENVITVCPVEKYGDIKDDGKINGKKLMKILTMIFNSKLKNYKTEINHMETPNDVLNSDAIIDLYAFSPFIYWHGHIHTLPEFLKWTSLEDKDYLVHTYKWSSSNPNPTFW